MVKGGLEGVQTDCLGVPFRLLALQEVPGKGLWGERVGLRGDGGGGREEICGGCCSSGGFHGGG